MGLRHLASAVLTALAVIAMPGAGSARAAESSTIALRGLTVDVDRDLGSQFGGRVDVTVRFRVVNTGSEAVSPTARIQLESQIGGGTTSSDIALAPMGPGDHVDVTRTAGSLLPFGSAHVTVSARADGDVTSATASTPVIPWFLLLTLAVLVALAVGVRFRSRRPEPMNQPARFGPKVGN